MISLFGGKYMAAVPVEDSLSSSSFIVPRDGHALQIDLRAKQFKQRLFAEYILQRPWLHPNNLGVLHRQDS